MTNLLHKRPSAEFTYEDACDLIEKLYSSEGEGWDYLVVAHPTAEGKFAVAVFDEDNQFVGDWTR